jgi:PIN domain nuclease of toxin-antitoxin system
LSLLLDTNALIWTLSDEVELGASARQQIEHAFRHGRLMASAVSFWEVAMLVAKKRISLSKSADRWRFDALKFGIEEIALDGEVAVDTVQLSGLHGDPMDRFIAATAIRLQAPLITSDARLLAWKGPLACIDARV